MTDDLISRSALVAALESRGAAAADPVIRLIFDRLIEVVKAQPAFPVCNELRALLWPRETEEAGEDEC